MGKTTPTSAGKRSQPNQKTSQRATLDKPDKPVKPARKPPHMPQQTHRSKWGMRVLVFIMLINSGALIGGGYFWYAQSLTARLQNTEQINHINQLATSFDAAEKNNQQRAQEIRNEIRDEIRNETQDEIRALANSVAALHSALGGDADKRRLEDAERLLVIANQRLQLSADSASARTALQLAYEHLAGISESTLTPNLTRIVHLVRTNIMLEIVSLDEMATVDIAGTLTTLAELSRRVDALPLAGDITHATVIATAIETDADNATINPTTDPTTNPTIPTTPNDNVSWVWAISKNLLADISAMVEIKNTDKPTSPILSAELRTIIYKQTKLIIESCQLALLRTHGDGNSDGDDNIYAVRMQSATHWIMQNFDTESPEVRAWLAQWAKLAAVSPHIETPDISTSLRMLRKAMHEISNEVNRDGN